MRAGYLLLICRAPSPAHFCDLPMRSVLLLARCRVSHSSRGSSRSENQHIRLPDYAQVDKYVHSPGTLFHFTQFWVIDVVDSTIDPRFYDVVCLPCSELTKLSDKKLTVLNEMGTDYSYEEVFADARPQPVPQPTWGSTFFACKNVALHCAAEHLSHVTGVVYEKHIHSPWTFDAPHPSRQKLMVVSTATYSHTIHQVLKHVRDRVFQMLIVEPEPECICLTYKIVEYDYALDDETGLTTANGTFLLEIESYLDRVNCVTVQPGADEALLSLLPQRLRRSYWDNLSEANLLISLAES
jgi:hypothetical protein